MDRRPYSTVVLAIALGGALTAGCNRPERRATAAPPAFAAKLDAAVEDAVAKREMPGAALVIVQGNQVTYSRGFGKANLATGEPVTDTTPFVIGSTSKPLTGLGVLRLVQLGKVALDTPIVRYAPDLAFSDPRGNAITLRHLLTNRSGLPIGFSGPAYRRPSQVDDSAVSRLAHAMVKMPLLFAPGQGYAYSNRGWALAGYLLERLGGKPAEQFLRDEVFLPLGMTQTTLEFWKVPNIAQGYAEGRSIRNHPHPASLSREYGPSGMVVSTPRDVGRLLIAMMNQGTTYDGKQFLTPELIAEALRPQAEATSELGGPTKYGLGWEVDSMMGTTTIRKAGSVHTLVSLWVMLPEKRMAMAFNFNREDYQIVPLIKNVFTVVSGGNADPWPASSPIPAPTEPTAVKIADAVRARWLGDYDTRIGDVSVYLRGDSLFTDYDGSEVGLIPTSDSTAALWDDILTNQGKVLTFRQRGGTTVMVAGADSLGLKIKP